MGTIRRTICLPSDEDEDYEEDEDEDEEEDDDGNTEHSEDK